MTGNGRRVGPRSVRGMHISPQAVCSRLRIAAERNGTSRDMQCRAVLLTLKNANARSHEAAAERLKGIMGRGLMPQV